MEQPDKKTQKITKKKKNQYLTLEFKMNYIAQLILMVFPVLLAAGLGFQLDVLLGVSLKKGGLLPKQTGPYLLDSFRVNSLIPAFERIQEELEELHISNHWEIVVMILLGLWMVVGNLFLAWKLRKVIKKRAEARAGPPV